MSTTILDYETIETVLGNKLRRSDNLDIHADHFFPVSILDRLFHYSEESYGKEYDKNKRVLHRNFHGHDFDRWIDNLVARLQLNLLDDEGNREKIELLDIDSMIVESDCGHIMIKLPDGTEYGLVDEEGRYIQAKCVDDLNVAIDLTTMFDRPPVDSDAEPYMGFGQLAHILRVVCEKSDINPGKVDAHKLSTMIFDHFKNELLPLIPSLWNDMDHIMHYATTSLISSN